MNHFIPIARALAAPLLNRVCFSLICLTSAASESPVTTVSASAGLVGTSFGLQSCRAELYLLDNMTYIETESIDS